MTKWKMRVGDTVFHVDYPSSKGRVVAKTKRASGKMQIFLVKWEGGSTTSRHIESALRKVR